MIFDDQRKGTRKKHADRWYTVFLFCLCLAWGVGPIGAGAGEKKALATVSTRQILPGDQVRIRLREDADVRFDGPVSADGLVALPYLGEAKIGGMTQQEAEAYLKKQLEKKLYVHATPSVLVLARAARFVFFYGAVVRQGKVLFRQPDGIPVLEALTEAGGVASWGDPAHAQILRRRKDGKLARIPLDIPRLYQDLDLAFSLKLQPDDVVFIPSGGAVSLLRRKPETFYVYGAVKFAGRRTLPEVGKMSVMQAVTEAGGLTSWAAPKKACILRLPPKGGTRERIPVDLASILEDPKQQLKIALQPNDILFIPSNAAGGSVVSAEPLEIIVTGEVVHPGIVLFAPGERLSFIRAIFKAGSFTEYAKSTAVRLVRYDADGTRKTRVINAKRILTQGHMEDDVELQPGDMIIIDAKRFNF